MPKSIDWNIYTILMVALVPALLLAAWGLETWDTRQLHQLQCTVAMEWLEESEDLAPQFVQAGSMDQTMLWISSFEEIEAPIAAGDLRWGILESARYHEQHYPDLPTDEPGVLNPPNGLFERQITDGANRLVDHCPETSDELTTAFPMIFREDNS